MHIDIFATQYLKNVIRKYFVNRLRLHLHAVLGETPLTLTISDEGIRTLQTSMNHVSLILLFKKKPTIKTIIFYKRVFTYSYIFYLYRLPIKTFVSIKYRLFVINVFENYWNNLEWRKCMIAINYVTTFFLKWKASV